MAANLAAGKISQALRRWKREGVNIDPTNEAHIAAYRLARQSMDRPRSDQVLAIIESQTVQHKSGASLTSEFWVVPRVNFPTGVPADLKKWSISETELRENYKVPKDTEFGTSYIFDGGCSRQALGRGVKSIAFSETLTRLQQASMSAALAPGGGNSACGSGGEDSAAEEAAPMEEAADPPAAGGVGTPAPTAPGAGGAAPNDPAAQTAAVVVAKGAAGAAADPIVGPPSKRARVLRLMGSEEGVAAEEVLSFCVKARMTNMFFVFLFFEYMCRWRRRVGSSCWRRSRRPPRAARCTVPTQALAAPSISGLARFSAP